MKFMIERKKRMLHVVFSLSLIKEKSIRRYCTDIPSWRSRVMEDLRVCFIRMFRMYLVNFMDNKSLQSCFFFFFNQDLLHLYINFKIQRKKKEI